MSSQEKKIVIIGSHSSPATLKSFFSSMHSAQWVYCGKDVPYSIELDRVLGTEKKIRIGNDLQNIAKEFRQEYIDFIGKISCSHEQDSNIDLWYLSSISEKNPFITNVFLYFCYVKICKRIVDNNDYDILIISEDPALSRAIFTHLKTKTTRKIFLEDNNDAGIFSNLKQQVHSTLRKIWFILINTYKVILAKIYSSLKREHRLTNQQKPQICIHSFTDNRSIQDNAHYRQVYFGNLGPDLTKSEIPFYYLIDILPTTSYLTILRKLLHYPEDCRLSEEFITISDIFRAYYHVKSTGFAWGGGLFLGDVLMDQILQAETDRDRKSIRREEAYLRFYAGKKIAQHTSVSSLVYIFENHIWEKMLCMAFRLYSPKTKIIGYAHTVVTRMYLCYSISSCERDILPLPDIIAVNGINAKRALEESGFLKEGILITGALRYQYLTKKKFQNKNHSKTIVLVALSAGVNDSVELAYKSFRALGDEDGYEIWLKCHPTTPFTTISRFFQYMPANVRICEEPIEELLINTDVLLHAGSAVCIQALAEGIPVIFVNSDHRIDMNILEDIQGVRSVATPDEIPLAICDASLPESLVQIEESQKIVGDIFSQVRHDYLSIILKNNVNSKFSEE